MIPRSPVPHNYGAGFLAAEGINLITKRAVCREKQANGAGYGFPYCTVDYCQGIPVCKGDFRSPWGRGKSLLEPLIQAGIRGVDRVVPIGYTMDFDLIWDGYNLVERLTRTIQM